MTITQRIDLGGPWVTATSDGVGRMFLATANTIEVHDLDNPRGKPLVVQVDGTIHDVAFEAGALWIAAGRAGLARWRPADGAAPGSAWSGLGEVVSVTSSGASIWAADRGGRVWRLSPAADVQTAPNGVVVDGNPARLASWGDGVLVDTGAGPMSALGPDLTPIPAPAVPDRARLAARDGTLYSAHLNTVGRYMRDGTRESVSLPFEVLAMTATPDGAVVVGDGGVVETWPFGAAQPVPWLADGTLSFEATDVDVAEDIAVFHNTEAVAWARLGSRGWEITGVLAEPRGVVTSLVGVAGGVAVGTARPNGHGEVVLFEDDGTQLVRRDAVPIGAVRDLAWVDPELWVAGVDIGLQRLTVDAKEGVFVRERAISDDQLLAVEGAGRGAAAYLSATRGVVWLEADEDLGWAEARVDAVGELDTVDLVVAAGQAIVSVEGLGATLLINQATGASERVPMGMAAERRDAPCPCEGRMLVRDGVVWLPGPELGLARLAPGREGAPDISVVPGGAWEVASWGDGLVVAAGASGVATLALNEDGTAEAVGMCPAVGETRRVVAIGERVVAAVGGTLVILSGE